MAEQTIAMPHKVVLSDRKKLTVTGVSEVLGFDDSSVQMVTPLGNLIVHGQQLRLKTLNPEGGQLEITGSIGALVYEQPRRRSGWLGRMLE